MGVLRMPTTVDRADLVRRLEMASPGLSLEDSIQQSSCFVFRNGWILTYNEYVACRVKSPLDKAFVGAVKAAPLLKNLARWPEDQINVDDGGDRMVIIGKRRRLRMIKEAEVSLGIDAVEKPAGAWTPLNPEFGEAIGLVYGCAATDNESGFPLMHVHVHPKWVEACDNAHLARYVIDTGMKDAFIVRPSSIKHIRLLGMKHFAETQSWVHFRNDQMYMSCRRSVEPYPDLKRGLDCTGVPATLPAGLAEACDSANILSEEYGDNNRIMVSLKPGDIYITGTGTHGEYDEAKKLKYDGPPIRFYINPKMLGEITKKRLECFIGDKALKIISGKLTYVAFLFPEKTKAKTKETPDEE